MRVLAIVALLVGVPAPSWGAEVEDDPKLARGSGEGRPRAWIPGADDPKLARQLSDAVRVAPAHPVPRIKLGYRRMVAAGLEGGELVFHAVSVDFYPLSWFIRLGLNTEAGFAGGPFGAWYVAEGVAIGLQYPARVTPFIEGRISAGLIGGSYMGQDVLSYVYTGALEAGVEVYYSRRFYLSGAIGWARPTYGGIDAEYARQHPGDALRPKELSYDAFTFKLGLGL